MKIRRSWKEKNDINEVKKLKSAEKEIDGRKTEENGN